MHIDYIGHNLVGTISQLHPGCALNIYSYAYRVTLHAFESVDRCMQKLPMQKLSPYPIYLMLNKEQLLENWQTLYVWMCDTDMPISLQKQNSFKIHVAAVVNTKPSQLVFLYQLMLSKQVKDTVIVTYPQIASADFSIFLQLPRPTMISEQALLLTTPYWSVHDLHFFIG